MTQKEIVRRLKLIRRNLPEGAWAELEEGLTTTAALTGKFATMLDLADDLIGTLIGDLEDSIWEQDDEQ